MSWAALGGSVIVYSQYSSYVITGRGLHGASRVRAHNTDDTMLENTNATHQCIQPQTGWHHAVLFLFLYSQEIADDIAVKQKPTKIYKLYIYIYARVR